MKKIISLGIITALLLPALAFGVYVPPNTSSLPFAGTSTSSPSSPLPFGGTATTTSPQLCSSIQLSSSTLGNIITWASCTLVKLVVPFLFTLAVVGFIWGIIQYYLNPTNEEKRKNGKTFMIWGVIALFVMISMWGLVGVLSNTFGVKTFLPQLSQ